MALSMILTVSHMVPRTLAYSGPFYANLERRDAAYELLRLLVGPRIDCIRQKCLVIIAYCKPHATVFCQDP